MKTNESNQTPKVFYINAIIELMEKCNDIPLLNLIYILLRKSV